MCCEFLSDYDLVMGNHRLQERRIDDVAEFTWKKVKDYGVKGIEDDDVYINKIRFLDKTGKEI